MQRIRLLLLIFLLPYLLLAQLPEDESYLDSSFMEFSRTLSEVIKAKDSLGLKSLMHERVITAFDAYDCAGGCTPGEVIQIYFSGSQADFHWDQMAQIIQYGFYAEVDRQVHSWIQGNRSDTLFKAPIFLRQLNAGYSTGHSLIYVLKDSLKAYREASFESSIISGVPIGPYPTRSDQWGNPRIYESLEAEWLRISLPNKEEAFILADFTSANIDRCLWIAKLEGVWQIVRYESTFAF